MQVSSFPQLSDATLLRVKGYLKKLDGREITPRKFGDPFTEEQIIGRKISRAIGSEILDPGPNAIPMTVTHGVSAPEPSLNQYQINNINKNLATIHENSMFLLSSAIRQIQILTSNPSFKAEWLDNQINNQNP